MRVRRIEPEEPDDQVVPSHRLTIHCILMCGGSLNIHLQGGGREPSLQPFLHEGKHGPDGAFPGVYWFHFKA